MRIDEILAGADRPVFSFEFFPPKTPAGEESLLRALEALGWRPVVDLDTGIDRMLQSFEEA